MTTVPCSKHCLFNASHRGRSTQIARQCVLPFLPVNNSLGQLHQMKRQQSIPNRSRCQRLTCLAERRSPRRAAVEPQQQSEKSDMVHAELIYFMFQLVCLTTHLQIAQPSSLPAAFVHRTGLQACMLKMALAELKAVLLAESRHTVTADAEHGRFRHSPGGSRQTKADRRACGKAIGKQLML